MTNALSALGLEVESIPHRVMLINPATGAPVLDEEGEQAYIEIDGYNSPAGEKLLRQVKLKQQMQGKKSGDVDLDKARAENALALAGLTRSWRLVNLKTGRRISDEDFPCNFENARTLYTDASWTAEQVGADLQDKSNFIKV